MRAILLYTGATLWVAAAAMAQQDDKTKQELAKLQGTWKILKAEKEGEPIPENKIKETQMVFAGDQMIFVMGEKKEAARITALDPSKKPATMDLVPEKGKIVVRGIYLLEKDTLTLCFSLDGKDDRPKEFKSGKDIPTGLFILQREKK